MGMGIPMSHSRMPRILASPVQLFDFRETPRRGGKFRPTNDQW